MRRYDLENIQPDYNGYQQLIGLYQEGEKTESFDGLEININGWFSADLCSPLGGILDILKENLISLRFGRIESGAEKILKKNGFLSHYSYPSMEDKYHTAIKYLKLRKTDSRYFFRFIERELINHPELPELSDVLKEKIAESIFEIFTNAQIHSETEHIYTCGQFYPAKQIIDFTITDTGMGFRERIKRSFGKEVRSVDAIKWAFNDRNTTKVGIPGGIGLVILKEFVGLNKGKIQVVSGNGFYKIDSNKEETREFRGLYPGTMVNVQFRTDDTKSYSLLSEDV
jgi:anti-sigma regulatory factor (Ser/Thr protein kinase)